MSRLDTIPFLAGEKSQWHFSTIRKNIFLWVEECYGLIYKGECQEKYFSLDRK